MFQLFQLPPRLALGDEDPIAESRIVIRAANSPLIIAGFRGEPSPLRPEIGYKSQEGLRHKNGF
jgi:hypothetical protein